MRHALRARGVVLICGGHTTKAFDVYTDRKLRYEIANGGPDPATLDDDKRALSEMIEATMESWHGRKISPVYHLMPNLQEPDWKSLRIGDVREFWERYDQWERRVELARKQNRIGDLLVLADEAPVSWFRAEAWIRAGQALRKAKRFAFALEQLERGLAIEPSNEIGLQEKGICLQRLAIAGVSGHSLDRARDHYRTALEARPGDPELSALLGRVEKDAWVAAWRPRETPEEKREDAAYEDALLRAAVDSYAAGFRADPRHYFSGINAVSLMHLHEHLTEDDRYQREMQVMGGAVRFAAEGESDPGQRYWAKVTLADLEVLEGTPKEVERAYKEAIAVNDKDWFALDSSRDQLVLFRELGFRLEAVEAGIAVFDRVLARLKKPGASTEPRQIFLFSGHMMDAPDRPEPRFPAAMEADAKSRIEETLERHGAGAEDVAYCQAAAGGDLLFLEACQERGVACRVHLPFQEAEFIQQSVLPSTNGTDWRDRFYAVKERANTTFTFMPDALGPLPPETSPFERCNLWLLYSALAGGVDKVRFLCLWNGGGGDGPGGTAHMHHEVSRRTGRVDWIDTREL